MAVTLWKYRRFVWINAVAELRHRYKGSVAGYLWNVFVPLAQITVFALIFGVIMGGRLDESPEGPKGPLRFVVYLCASLLPWNGFADTLIRSSGSMVSNAGYLRKLAIPEQIFVAKDAIGGGLAAGLTLLVFAFFAMIMAHWGPMWPWVQAVPLLALFVAFAYGLGLILSCLNVFFRDIQPLMGVIMLLWMWLTPVVWVEKIFEKSPLVLTALKFNPAYYYITAFQETLFKGQWVSPAKWGMCIFFALAANAIARPVLRKLRAEIRDVV